MEKRFLITTAEEKTWRTDCSVLFLGKWCNLYNRREIWENLDSKTVPYHWDDREKLYKDCIYLEKLYEEILLEMKENLNKFHNVNYSSSYWRILIGPWLSYFIHVLFDRYTMIQKAVEKFNISETLIFNFPKIKTVPRDISHFDDLIKSDIGNHIIYSRIIEEWTKIPFKKVDLEIPYILNFSSKKERKVLKIQNFLKFFKREKDAFLIGTYISAEISFFLQTSMRQIPQFWERENPLKIEADDLFRSNFEIKKDGFSGFEHCLRTLIAEQIPSIYLEGYKNLSEKISSLPWPKKPKLIFTSNNHNSDEIFKAFAAKKKESGVPLIIGQHGGSYGSSLWHSSERHEIKIADRYFTWGWKGGKNVFPIGALKLFGRSSSYSKRGNMLIVMSTMPQYSYRVGSYIVSAGQVEEYLNDAYNFVKNIKKIPNNKILVRNYVHDNNWSQSKRWSDKFPGIKIDEGKTSMKYLVSQSRLYVSTYNATTFLESLGFNVPTIIFWNPKYWELRKSAVPYFKELKKVGIFHETPESAARKASEVWNDVEKWWNNKEVQKARKFFCNEFAYLPDNPVYVLKKGLIL